MSQPNETRERALARLQTPLTDLPTRDLATLAGSLYGAERLARELGATLSEALDRLWSWDLTCARAADAVSAAQHEIDREFVEADAKRKRKRTGRRW